MRSGSEHFVITTDEYVRFRQALEASSGIVLGDGKEYLVVSRLRKLMTERSLPSISELLYCMERERCLQNQVIDAMTTNETLWFRDTHPYETFRNKILPELASKCSPVRIWSAACSTGQEPYSLKIEEIEYQKHAFKKLRQPIKILATDISRTALDQSKAGVYPWIAIRRGMPEDYLNTYFTAAGQDAWKVNEEVRVDIEFREFNLQNSYSHLGKFDVIYCRNVLIYFSQERKRDILTRFHAQLSEGGYLVLGASEGVSNMGDYYEMVPCNPGIIYRAKELAANG